MWYANTSSSRDELQEKLYHGSSRTRPWKFCKYIPSLSIKHWMWKLIRNHWITKDLGRTELEGCKNNKDDQTRKHAIKINNRWILKYFLLFKCKQVTTSESIAITIIPRRERNTIEILWKLNQEILIGLSMDEWP